MKETGLPAKFVKKGDDFSISDRYGDWLIHPFLFESNNEMVTMVQADHDTYEWIDAKDLDSYDTAKGLNENLKALEL